LALRQAGPDPWRLPDFRARRCQRYGLHRNRQTALAASKHVRLAHLTVGEAVSSPRRESHGPEGRTERIRWSDLGRADRRDGLLGGRRHRGGNRSISEIPG